MIRVLFVLALLLAPALAREEYSGVELGNRMCSTIGGRTSTGPYHVVLCLLSHHPSVKSGLLASPRKWEMN